MSLGASHGRPARNTRTGILPSETAHSVAAERA